MIGSLCTSSKLHCGGWNQKLAQILLFVPLTSCSFYMTSYRKHGIKVLDLQGALMSWPTRWDQPMGCRRGLHMWHQKPSVVFCSASLWSAYTSRSRPPTIVSTRATRVRPTCLGSTTSTIIPNLKGVLILSASWGERSKRWRALIHDISHLHKQQRIIYEACY